VGQIPAEVHNRRRDVARSARAEVQVLLIGERLVPGAKQSIAVDTEDLGVASAANEIKPP
jgi:hypothetical protein